MKPSVTKNYQSLPMIYIQGKNWHGMSTQTPANNVYSLYTQNVQKYFENISKITPQYFQSITQMQEECMKVCQKTINASVSMQQEIAKKSGISTDIPESARTAIVDTNKQIVQASTVSNQLANTAIDATVQNIKTFGDNVNAFVDLNKNIIQTWITPFAQTK
jgi:arginyl-tRNA synthetase